MDIIIVGEVREKKEDNFPLKGKVMNNIMPTIHMPSALVIMEKLDAEIRSQQNFKNLDNTEKELLAKNSLWNKLVTLRENQQDLRIGPLQMQLSPQEIKDAQNTIEKEQAIHYVKNFGGYLEYLPKQFQDDEDIVALAMVHDTYNFQYASERIRSDKRTVLILLQYNELLADGISDALKEEIGQTDPKLYLQGYFLNEKFQKSIPVKLDSKKTKSKI